MIELIVSSYMFIGFFLPIVIYAFNKEEANRGGVDALDILVISFLSAVIWLPMLIYTFYNPNWVD